jgi:20S proteasome alpha/beta subunit
VTTIVYRDGVLAADRRATTKGKRYAGIARKIGRNKGGWLFGACGIASDTVLFQQWMLSWPGKKRPNSAPPDGEYEALAISPSGQVFAAEPGAMWPYETEFVAIGSGMATALGALYHGASAREAVEIASLVDTATGDGVDTLSLS